MPPAGRMGMAMCTVVTALALAGAPASAQPRQPRVEELHGPGRVDAVVELGHQVDAPVPFYRSG